MKKWHKTVILLSSGGVISLLGLDLALSKDYGRAAKLCVGTGICRHTEAFGGNNWSSSGLPYDLSRVIASKGGSPDLEVKKNTLLLTYKVGDKRFIQASPLVRTDKGFRPSSSDMFLATMRALVHLENPDLSNLAQHRDAVAEKASEYYSLLEQSCGGKVVLSSGKTVSREEFLGDLAKLAQIAREDGGAVRHFQLTGSE